MVTVRAPCGRSAGTRRSFVTVPAPISPASAAAARLSSCPARGEFCKAETPGRGARRLRRAGGARPSTAARPVLGLRASLVEPCSFSVWLTRMAQQTQLDDTQGSAAGGKTSRRFAS